MLLASVISLTSCRPEESAKFDRTNESDESEGFLNFYNYYGSIGSIELVEPKKEESQCESNETEELDINLEEDEDDYDYGCPKECVDIIADFIENRREDDFMYFKRWYKCTRDIRGCRFLYLDTAEQNGAMEEPKKEDDSEERRAYEMVFFLNKLFGWFLNEMFWLLLLIIL